MRINKAIKIMEEWVLFDTDPQNEFTLEPEEREALTTFITSAKAISEAGELLPEKKKTKDCENCNHYHTMLEHGCSCKENGENVGFNEYHDLAQPVVTKKNVEIEKLTKKCHSLSISNTMRRVEMQQEEIAQLKAKVEELKETFKKYGGQEIFKEHQALKQQVEELEAENLDNVKEVTDEFYKQKQDLHSQLAQAQKNAKEWEDEARTLRDNYAELHKKATRLHALMDRERIEKIIIEIQDDEMAGGVPPTSVHTINRIITAILNENKESKNV